jgi:hypothetical protein
MLALILLITLALAGYALSLVARPFADCRHCAGMGHAIDIDRKGKAKRGKPCRHCKTTGKRIRFGRHLLNLWLATYRDGTH